MAYPNVIADRQAEGAYVVLRSTVRPAWIEARQVADTPDKTRIVLRIDSLACSPVYTVSNMYAPDVLVHLARCYLA